MLPANPQPLPQLRDDLDYTVHRQGDQYWYAIHDPLNGHFYRLGSREYALASRMDGSLTAEQLAEQSKSDEGIEASYGSEKCTEAEIVQLAAWLQRSGLTQTNRPPSVVSPNYRRWQFNLLSMRLPLVPGHYLESWLSKVAAWIDLRLGYAILAVYSVALIYALANWSKISGATSGLFVADSKLHWLLAWLILKVVHELGHGLVALKMGSQIRAAGINVIFLAPIPYVDLSDLWTISSRWQRIACALAGMLAEMLVASLATVIAIHTSSESIRYFCCALAITGTVTTLLFNANPLMRFDGYFVLADLLGIPNLWTQAQTSIQALISTCLIPWKRTVQPIRWHYAVYGGLSMAYRMMMMLTLAITAILLWDGFGVVLAVWGGYALYVHPWVKKFSQPQSLGTSPTRKLGWQQIASSAAVVGITIAALQIAPSPVPVTSPAVVYFHDPMQINAHTSGTLESLHVQVGQSVEIGQTLAVLTDSDLWLQFKTKELETQAIRESLRTQQARGHLAELQSAQAKLHSLESQLAQLRTRVEGLTITAPRTGTVVQLSLSNCLGQQVTAGQPLCTIAPSHELEVKVSASQRDLAQFQRAIGQPVELGTALGQRQLGHVDKVHTSGHLYLSEPLLAGCYGGPVAVEFNDTDSTDKQRWRLLEPRFDIHVRLPANTTLLPGQLVWVQVPGQSTSIAQAIASWLRHQWKTVKHNVSTAA